MFKNLLKTAIITLPCMLFVSICPNCIKSARAQNIEPQELKINAKSAYLIDAATGTEIYSKNADQSLPIASMTKLATLSVIFSEINNGRLNLEDKVSVSQTAADTEGSSAFLDAGSTYKVADLIKTIVMVSANDSCVAMAEHISGSEQGFAVKMNKLAEDLKLTNTNFKNSTGLPVAGHYSSAKDIAKIYQTVCDNPVYIKYSKIWMEDFIHPSGRKTGLVNTNRLIKTYEGCDSGKTGHTDEAKYCLTASATRGGTRLISVIIGAETSKDRFDQTKAMFNYGFANYQSKPIINAGSAIADISVKGAKHKSITAYAKDDYIAFIKKGEDKTFSTHVVSNTLNAPIHKGDKIGTVLVLDENNIVIEEIDLISKTDVPKITIGQILDNIYNAW